MPSRESQGLQIALILFVMITVVLAVTTYIYFRKASDTTAKASDLTAKLAKSQQDSKAYDFAFDLTKQTLGLGDANPAAIVQMKRDLENSNPEVWADVKKILDRFEQDKNMYGKGITNEFSYVDLPEHLIKTINQKNDEVARLQQQVQGLQQQMAQAVSAEKMNTQKAEEAQRTHLTDLETEQTKYRKDVADITKKKQDIFSEVEKKNKEFQKLQDSTNEKISQLEKTINDQDILIVGLQTVNLSKNDENFDSPDGKVLYVNPAAETVLINLGFSDGLQRNTSFVVYDSDVGNFARAQSKGKIEIARVLDDHSALAKIVETEDIANPILTEDIIYTPTWRPGEKVLFAITGGLDIDKDGQSDRAFIKGLIEQNGGTVVAEVDPDSGDRSGEMSPKVRYLIEGTPPKRPEGQDQHAKIINESLQYGVERMSVEKFMSYMRFRPDTATVRLGRSALITDGASGAKPEAAGETKSAGEAGSGGFRERRPPARGAFGGGY